MASGKVHIVVRNELLPQMVEFECLWVLFTSEGWREQETDTWIHDLLVCYRQSLEQRSLDIAKELHRPGGTQ